MPRKTPYLVEKRDTVFKNQKQKQIDCQFQWGIKNQNPQYCPRHAAMQKIQTCAIRSRINYYKYNQNDT